MAFAEGAPVSVGVVEGGMAPASPVAPVSSLSSFSAPISSESLVPKVNFPGFSMLSGDVGPVMSSDVVGTGINPFGEGWVNYSPVEMGDGMFPPGLAVAQAMEVAANAWEASNPLSGYSVIAEAVQDATLITGESAAVLAENSSDTAVAARVAELAQELGLDPLAKDITEDYGLALASGDELISSEVGQENGVLGEDAAREVIGFTEAQPVADDEQAAPDTLEGIHVEGELNDQSEETGEDTTETDEEIELLDGESENEKKEQEENTDGEEQEDRKDEEQRPPVSPPRPMVSESTDERREQLVIAAVNRESREAKERGKRFSVSTIADTFERNAAESPIRKQLGLVVGEEQGVKSIAISLRSQTFVSSPATILHTARAAIAQHSAVVLATTGTEASQEAVEGALGSSRRNPFS